MKSNVGGLDKTLRLIVGLVIIAWGILNHNWLGVIGLVPLLTALVNFCPLYSILGMNTGKKLN